jgi:hypothetical protein
VFNYLIKFNYLNFSPVIRSVSVKLRYWKD